MAAAQTDYILIVDDDQELATDFGRLLEGECGLRTEVVGTVAEARKMLHAREPALIFLDLFLQGENGGIADSVKFLASVRESHRATPVVIVTAYPHIPDVVDTIKAGAYDFLPRPLGEDRARLGVIVRNAIDLRRSQLTTTADEFAILGESGAIRTLREQILRVARSDVEVMILGETGTGKELVARAIHNSSPRSAQPLIKLAASAIPESLFESELFGHTKGAFTSAERERVGAFEAAGRGTLFLDELSEMPASQQAKLLRVLETGDYKKIGEDEERQRHCRVLAASNRDIEELVDGRHIRRDLFDRFDYIMQVPPLRARKEDIGLLARHFIKSYSRDESSSMPTLNPSAEEYLLGYDYPGNVRELRNIIRRALLFSDRGIIDRELLREHWPPGCQLPPDESPSLRAAKRSAERDAIVKALAASGNNRTAAAALLGISRQRLHELIKEHGIDRP